MDNSSGGVHLCDHYHCCLERWQAKITWLIVNFLCIKIADRIRFVFSTALVSDGDCLWNPYGRSRSSLNAIETRPSGLTGLKLGPSV